MQQLKQMSLTRIILITAPGFAIGNVGFHVVNKQPYTASEVVFLFALYAAIAWAYHRFARRVQLWVYRQVATRIPRSRQAQ